MLKLSMLKLFILPYRDDYKAIRYLKRRYLRAGYYGHECSSTDLEALKSNLLMAKEEIVITKEDLACLER
jgi:hypothetical protein